MTNEKALYILEHCHDLKTIYPTKDTREALDVAIRSIHIVDELEKCKAVIGGRLNGRAYAYKCGREEVLYDINKAIKEIKFERGLIQEPERFSGYDHSLDIIKKHVGDVK